MCKFLIIPETINHKPIIEKAPKNMTLVIGQTGQMECDVISSLHPHIEWIYGSCGINCSEDAVLKVMVPVGMIVSNFYAWCVLTVIFFL